jgi:ssDNA-binding Zn-finger/Zn-ribbon topoisomerase 1
MYLQTNGAIPEQIIECPNCQSINLEMVFKIKNWDTIIYDFCPDCKFTDRIHQLKLNMNVGNVLEISAHRYNKKEVKDGIR